MEKPAGGRACAERRGWTFRHLSNNPSPWFDRLTTNGAFPFVLSLSKDRKRPLLKLLDRR
jgi:hypothetical protein